MKYAEIILPIPLHGTFTYAIPKTLTEQVNPGHRAIVPFGAKKILTGIVSSLHDESPAFDAKEILDLIDDYPIVNNQQLAFYQWIASYYMCTLGEVTNAALPAALKMLSESYLSINPEVNPDDLHELSDREFSLVEALRTSSEISIKDVADIIGLKQPQRIIKHLAERGIIDLFEKVSDKYVPKKIKRIKLTDQYLEERNLEELINELDKRPKQQDILLAYLKLLPILENPSLNENGIEKAKLLKEDISTSSLKTLQKNGVLQEWEMVASRFPKASDKQAKFILLSEAQSTAKTQIEEQFEVKQIVLLHGITGSGKTEIYVELIKEQLNDGKQVLFLLPEIALTTQIISRLQKVFGDTFGIYHSKYSDNERVEIWNKVLQNEFQFVIGVRSAIFLPFSDLGLIIIDEEHEQSYKQFEPAPRYHARDAGIYLAHMHQAKVLLGTATPAFDTYQNATSSKYGLVELFERYGDSYTPKIEFADIRKERKQHKLKGNFASTLVASIEAALAKKEQVIVFQNRRGYASHVACDNCGHIPKCPNCDVSLTYHQFNNKLVCHYCGANQSMYSDCVKCGHKELRNVGFGTEEIEEELKIMFPNAIIQRMDLDTTRSKYGYQRIIESFEEGEIDILVGTQMVSKGLDFDKVNLVGVLDADRLIHFPHFRSFERAFQLILQVSGRAGRKSQEGSVIIQTSDPQQHILSHIANGNYQAFYQEEVAERTKFRFPPFNRLIRIVFQHPDKEVAYQGSLFFLGETKKKLGAQRVDGPVEPVVNKIRNKYLFESFIRLEKEGISISWVKRYLWEIEKMTKNMKAFKSLGVIFDVDPI